MANETARDGHLFVCCACGRTSSTRYGFDENNKSTATPGWDESCMLNASEFPVSRLVFNESFTCVVEVLP